MNPGDTVVADKIASALTNKSEEQIEFLQSLVRKLSFNSNFNIDNYNECNFLLYYAI